MVRVTWNMDTKAAQGAGTHRRHVLHLAVAGQNARAKRLIRAALLHDAELRHAKAMALSAHEQCRLF